MSFTHPRQPGDLDDGHLVFQNGVEHVESGLVTLVRCHILHRMDIFADQLATDGIVEQQQPFPAQNGPETAASEGSVIDKLAEGVGFEPTNPCGLTVFKTVAFVHSAIPPRRVARCNQRSRQRLPAHLF